VQTDDLIARAAELMHWRALAASEASTDRWRPQPSHCVHNIACPVQEQELSLPMHTFLLPPLHESIPAG
jgi:hypothetical protein